MKNGVRAFFLAATAFLLTAIAAWPIGKLSTKEGFIEAVGRVISNEPAAFVLSMSVFFGIISSSLLATHLPLRSIKSSWAFAFLNNLSFNAVFILSRFSAKGETLLSIKFLWQGSAILLVGTSLSMIIFGAFFYQRLLERQNRTT